MWTELFISWTPFVPYPASGLFAQARRHEVADLNTSDLVSIFSTQIRLLNIHTRQVCAISIVTSIIFYTMPVAGACRECTTNDPEHCIQGWYHTVTYFQEYRYLGRHSVNVGGQGVPSDDRTHASSLARRFCNIDGHVQACGCALWHK